ncbi:Phosphoribosylformylglycinamidine synthase [Slackia heliotrinireducens]|uniref:Phosphoribosylformylglycinamidine synthase n=1 Tax=Slackia heliotrinireducens (strain ATCC 29202 / DSM 20476 / NCTC 11029 / RHS 1) TaxID=471855 RepID=C7N3X0_SLAHD|nr:phosphoribosylformylglycinamidine synthase [Slackia heliotrinireducens]ACV21711.1 phosphoribosylformylglycinamidine synthase [Slackia heliotrinireducens DSM 20476]VEG99350.1 Phosphoribosylformylglycinamidine synthase [Slackia heliotrinireducens]
MVYRVYVEKKPGFDVEAQQLKNELKDILGIDGITAVRLVNRYDVEGIDQTLFESCVPTVFSEPQSDNTFETLDQVKAAGTTDATIIAVEYLPGQFDQRADSASECVQLISQGERPAVASCKVYLLEGELTEADIAAVKHHLINPVEAREASLDTKDTLKMAFVPPADVEILEGFNDLNDEELSAFISNRGLAMDLGDIQFCQKYFTEEGRVPTITEIKMIDTYWSDHCRHTTFGTVFEDVEFNEPAVEAAFERYKDLRRELGRENKPMCLMDIGTIGAKTLKARGILTNMDESEEINACTVKVKVDVDGEEQDWLYLFKNETHNHPTEIEPFGGAATCVGGAIRDPLSGRSYVYQAMRVTGAADPLVPVSETIPGKLPQRKIVTDAAHGYSSYGNQIGLATGQVAELYHPGYMAKRMEIGAVVGATPADHVRRETPAPGDRVILLGGRTGRDGIGGATGSSKAHNMESLESCGAEVQKGNAPVERKIQRLFRRGDACRMIKRCNDFGAGGVSVAIGELADGLYIDLDRVPTKYDGLDGTELAISESQERMAVDVAAEDVDAFIALAHEENLEATVVARVTEEPRVQIVWRGTTIVDVSREFLASNGAPKSQKMTVLKAEPYALEWPGETLEEKMLAMVSDLNVCSKKGLVERFDSTIGAATVLMPFGGKHQLTPSMAMAAKFPVAGETTTCSGMAWGFNPYLSSADQYHGAYLAVAESVSKLVAAGFERRKAYLTLQEYFEKLGTDPARWGKPLASVLGALDAQIDLGVGAIGGKDSMSGSFEKLDVPPTLVSFATAVGTTDRVVSPEFKQAGSRVAIIVPMPGDNPIAPQGEALCEAMDLVEGIIGRKDALAVSTCGFGGAAQALFEMCLGNGIGIRVDKIPAGSLFSQSYGTFLIELAEGAELPVASDKIAIAVIGETTNEYAFEILGEKIDMAKLQEAWESKLEPVFPYRGEGPEVEAVTFTPNAPAVTASSKLARPRVIIPVFPGNNCEYDSARAFERAGAEVKTFVINNLSPEAVAESTQILCDEIAKSQIIMLPGGFSGGDEPDGSAKFITAFFRAPQVTEAVRDLLQNRDGLMLGICNGFQALVKLGLVPFGDIRAMNADCPTLTFNNIGRHQSRLVNTRVASTMSPWLASCTPGDIHTIAISHGEGRFVANEQVLAQMKSSGQIATQYVDLAGQPTMALGDNPNGSVLAIEGITSPDGRVFGKMGHTERIADNVFKNVPGNKWQPIFENGVAYFA